MRQVLAILGLGTLALAGCNQMKWFRPAAPLDAGMTINSSSPPTPESIVAMLNDNARRIQSIESHDVELAVSQGNFNEGTINALMACQKPRNFNLSGKVLNNTVALIGSNEREFWWWISKDESHRLYHCSYDDLARMRDKIQLPFQPDWIIEALGMAEYNPTRPYQLVPRGKDKLELVENTVLPQGQQVRKVTTLTRQPNQQMVVSAHLIQDPSGKEICRAEVLRSQRDPSSGAILPQTVSLQWPADKLKMKIVMRSPQVNGSIAPDRAQALFTRPNLRDVPTYDLAKGPDPVGSVQPAGGFTRR